MHVLLPSQLFDNQRHRSTVVDTLGMFCSRPAVQVPPEATAVASVGATTSTPNDINLFVPGPDEEFVTVTAKTALVAVQLVSEKRALVFSEAPSCNMTQLSVLALPGALKVAVTACALPHAAKRAREAAAT